MNARVETLPHKTDTAALYARYPHLQHIELIWGTRECRRYLLKLMTDSRGGKRHGFEPDHALTIMRLQIEHDNLFPQYENEPVDLRWGDERIRPNAR